MIDRPTVRPTAVRPMIDRLASKRTVLAVVLASASIVLLCSSRVWVSGSVDDVTLGAGRLRGTGSQVAPGALAAALVGMAAAVVVGTAGRIVRVVAAGAALMAAFLGSAVVVSVLVDPGDALGKLAASSTARSGSLTAHGRVEGWAWVALAALLVMGIGGLGAMVGGRRWQGLSSRYDAADPAERDGSAWEQLSRGEDPTAEH